MARVKASLVSLSATALLTLLLSEGYTDRAVIPTKGDVPTVGFGSTVYPDGTRVQIGDEINPVRAIIVAQDHISKAESQFRDTIPDVLLYQAEYDQYMDFIYQYGIGTWKKSSMLKHLLDGEYRQACDALLLYKYSGGYDCSTVINGTPNKICYGSWLRQLERHDKCVSAGGGQ